MMSSESISADVVAYPPAAHTPTAHVRRTSREVINVQPNPAQTMSTTALMEDRERPQRLRGGCIPLPVRLSPRYDVVAMLKYTLRLLGWRDVLHHPMLLLTGSTYTLLHGRLVLSAGHRVARVQL